MSYSVNQYLHFVNSDDSAFMTQIPGSALKVEIISSGSGMDGASFSNAGLVYNSYQRAKSYYLHCEFGKKPTEQIFFVKLMNKSNSSRQQFVKKIIVPPGSADAADMTKIDFIFTPVETFDTLVFELQGGGTSHILFRELSEINNIIPTKITGERMYKIGVQATSGLKMCINNEEIQVGKTGVYEIDNDMVQIYYFSVVSPAKYNGEIAKLNQQREIALSTNYGYIHMNNNHNVIPSFSLDYIYEEA